MSGWRWAVGALWPKRLAAQLIALLLCALLASQVLSLAILLDERRHALRAAERAQVLARTASIVRLVEATPPELHPHILRTASSPRLRFWVDAANAVDGTVAAHRRNPLQARLAELLDGSTRQVLVELSDQPRELWGWFERRQDEVTEADDTAVSDGRPGRSCGATPGAARAGPRPRPPCCPKGGG